MRGGATAAFAVTCAGLGSAAFAAGATISSTSGTSAEAGGALDAGEGPRPPEPEELREGNAAAAASGVGGARGGAGAAAGMAAAACVATTSSTSGASAPTGRGATPAPPEADAALLLLPDKAAGEATSAALTGAGGTRPTPSSAATSTAGVSTDCSLRAASRVQTQPREAPQVHIYPAYRRGTRCPRETCVYWVANGFAGGRSECPGACLGGCH